MGLTLSHLSALDVLRTLRAEGTNIHEMDVTRLDTPSPWKGERWSKRNFASEYWQLPIPSKTNPLDILVPNRDGRIRLQGINTHATWVELPPRSILWIDEHAAVVRPELMFLQVAEVFSLPALVMLGYELCGHFSRSALNPRDGNVTMDLPAATTVEDLRAYLSSIKRGRGIRRAKEALRYVSDHAISAPEAVLATMYSLPARESGYGLGPLTLNKRVGLADSEAAQGQVFNVGNVWQTSARFPDLLLGIAPVGINYDGEDHLDLPGLVVAARKAALADESDQSSAQEEVRRTMKQIRNKVIDDNQRNRQLISRGYIVLPATKEDLYGKDRLDEFTMQLLACAHHYFGIDVAKYESIVNDTSLKRDRYDLLRSLLPAGGTRKSSHGVM